jgi:hypothetical protein
MRCGTRWSKYEPVLVMDRDTNDFGCMNILSIVSLVFFQANDTVGRFDAIQTVHDENVSNRAYEKSNSTTNT